jgi:hypothetical protein
MLSLKALLGRETAMPELKTIVDGLSFSVSSRRSRARVQMSIISSIVKLVSKEALPFEKPTSYAFDPYRQIASAELEFADSEERAKDDLQDIIERHKVIQRIESQYGQVLNQVQAAKTAVAQAELTYSTVNSELGPHRQKAEQDLAKAQVDKREIILRARDLTDRLIEAKERFAKFRLNRLRHAWITYSEALSKYGRVESNLYGALSRSVADLRKRLNGEVVHMESAEGSAKLGEAKDAAEIGSDDGYDGDLALKAVAFWNPFDVPDEVLAD